MATNKVLVTVGTQIVFADHASDYVGGGGNNSLEIAGSTDVQIDIAPAGVGLATQLARQSAKVDLGAARAAAYAVMISCEPADDPTAGDTIDLYWSPSPDSVAAVGNAGGASGTDAAYAASALRTLVEGLNQMLFIDSFPLAVSNDADGVQIGLVGIFVPPDRYGSLIVHNNSAVSLHTDGVEFAVSFQPIEDQIQAAV